MIAIAEAATEIATTATETAHTFMGMEMHITFGEFLVSFTAILLTLPTIWLAYLSTREARKDSTKVAVTAIDTMGDVAEAAITRTAPVAPKAPTYTGAPRHPHGTRMVRRNVRH